MRSTFVLAVLAACTATPAPLPVPVAGPASLAPTPSAPPARSAPPAAKESDEIPTPNRALTTDERALFKPVFRDGIDYDKVRVIHASFPFQPDGVYMTPRGHVYAPGNLYRDDFAHESARMRAIFVHELTHVWQHTNGMDLIGQSVVEFTKYRGAYEKAYAYTLETKRDLVDYGMEQQASIVEDYYLINENQTPTSLENRGLSPKDRNALYGAVLQHFLGNARYARSLSPKEVADRHAMLSEKYPPGPDPCSVTERASEQMCAWRFKPVQPLQSKKP
jgi:hypothetical protein